MEDRTCIMHLKVKTYLETNGAIFWKNINSINQFKNWSYFKLSTKTTVPYLKVLFNFNNQLVILESPHDLPSLSIVNDLITYIQKFLYEIVTSKTK